MTSTNHHKIARQIIHGMQSAVQAAREEYEQVANTSKTRQNAPGSTIYPKGMQGYRQGK